MFFVFVNYEPNSCFQTKLWTFKFGGKWGTNFKLEQSKSLEHRFEKWSWQSREISRKLTDIQKQLISWEINNLPYDKCHSAPKIWLWLQIKNFTTSEELRYDKIRANQWYRKISDKFPLKKRTNPFKGQQHLPQLRQLAKPCTSL